MDRRRFVKSASLGTAGLLLGSVVSKGQDGILPPESPAKSSPTAWGRVWVRWNQPSLPSKSLHAHGLAIPWPASPGLVKSARKQGYLVYAAATLDQASTAADNCRAMGLSGVVLEAGDSEQEKAEKTAAQLRLAHPNLTVLSTDPRAKQPAMMGSTVITDHGILQISSPTEQPWIDSNVALVGFDRAFRPRQTPLLDFHWDLPDALQQQLGPSTESYLLAVAEAGALHSDLVLNLHPTLEKALLSDNDQAWARWKRIGQYIEFYLGGSERPVAYLANVAVMTDNFDTSYEATNLMARHNIPFRMLPTTQVTSQDLDGLDLIVVFAQPGAPVLRRLADFVQGGGEAILVNLQNQFPGQSSGGRRVSADSMIYTLGKGKVIEIAGGVADPGKFSEDVRRLLGNERLPISLWNASTVIAIPYTFPGARTATVELLNYSADPMPVQVRIQGTYSEARYETPDHGCCQVLPVAHQDGFTQFDVPWLNIGGRVHLDAKPVLQRKTSTT